MKRKGKLQLANHLNDLQEVDPNIFSTSASPTCPLVNSTTFSHKPDENQLSRAQHQFIETGSLKFESFQQTSFGKSLRLASDTKAGDLWPNQQKASSSPESSHSKLFEKIIQTKEELISQKKRPQRQTKLREAITRQKVKVLKNQFINKLKRNNIYSPPIDFDIFYNKKESILQNEGFQITPFIDNTITLLSIFQIIVLFIMYTLALVFPQIEDAYAINILQLFSFVFYFLEIIYTSVTVKCKEGRKLHTFQQILRYYLHDFLIIDVVNWLILLIDISSSIYILKYLRLFLVMKLPECLQKIEKLQAFFVKNYYNEQYWSLIKVMLFNFCFAHILAIFLTAVAKLNDQKNWYGLKDISHGSWFQKYVWAYYWGVNIMLTVGFGDLVPVTYQQAICLIFIEIISVMCLAYNINWIGTLISNIRLQDLEKSKNIKTFKQLSEKYQLPDELQWRINNYINQSVNIRKKFNIQQEHSFIKSLPQTLKKEYLQESNKSIFQELPFFSNFIDKTLYQFAERIEMSISHPEQPLKRIDDKFNLMILREGEVAFVAKKRNCSFNGMVIDRMKVYGQQKPFILELSFLTNERPAYEIKSLQYSVIYTLEYHNLISVLKDSHLDYEHFCLLRDKTKCIIDQFQVLKCNFCHNQKHTKFNCPKLHFIPLKQVTIFKQQNAEKRSKNNRNKDLIKRQTSRWQTLRKNRQLKQYLQDLRQLASSSSIVCKRMAERNNLEDPVSHYSSHTSNNFSSFIMQDEIFKNTSEAIRQEFEKISKFQNCEDEVWLINCDRMKNYQEYFSQSNPSLLHEKFKLSKRLKRFKKMLDNSIRNQNRALSKHHPVSLLLECTSNLPNDI